MPRSGPDWDRTVVFGRLRDDVNRLDLLVSAEDRRAGATGHQVQKGRRQRVVRGRDVPHQGRPRRNRRVEADEAVQLRHRDLADRVVLARVGERVQKADARVGGSSRRAARVVHGHLVRRREHDALRAARRRRTGEDAADHEDRGNDERLLERVHVSPLSPVSRRWGVDCQFFAFDLW